MSAYKVYTIVNGTVSEGASVQNFTLANNEVTIQAVVVGEEGRGRQLGVLPVGNAPMAACPNRFIEWNKKPDERSVFYGNEPGPMPDRIVKCEKCGVSYTPWHLYRFDNSSGGGQGWRCEHPDRGEILGMLMAAEIGTTKSGKPKLWAKSAATSDEKVIVVFRTGIGFRGGNSHTGDRKMINYRLSSIGQDKVRTRSQEQQVEVGEAALALAQFDSSILYKVFDEETKWGMKQAYGLEDTDFESADISFEEFPGEILSSGKIAQGAAGRMGDGCQMVVVMPENVVFRTGYSGRLYGSSPAHYYIWNGEKILAATWEERTLGDLF